MGKEAIRQARINIDYIASDIFHIRALIDSEAYDDTIKYIDSAISSLVTCKGLLVRSASEIMKN